MTNQRIWVSVGAVIDNDKWRDHHETSLKNYVETAIQDYIDKLQGGAPSESNYNNVIVEIEYDEPI